jgi:hypothetical protein
LYGPSPVTKLRQQTPGTSRILETFEDCVIKLYQGRIRVTEQLQTSEWAMIGSLGNDEISGIIQAYHRLQGTPEVQSSAPAFNLRIRDAGLKTQNYGKWFDRFIREFDPDEEMSATMALSRGQCGDHGWEVYRTQGFRRSSDGKILTGRQKTLALQDGHETTRMVIPEKR